MKNDKIIALWNKILPDEAADERMLSKIMEYQHSFEKKERVISMTNTMKKFNAYSCTQIYVLIFKTN